MSFEQVQRIQFLIERKKYREAHASLTQALSDSPDEGSLHGMQAQLFLEEDDLKKAMLAINTAIGLQPENDFHHSVKSRIYHQMGEHKKALESIDEAIRLDAEYAHYYGQRALVLLALEKKQEAISAAKEGLEMEADNDLCVNVLSMALGSSGKVEESREVLGDLLAENPENALTQANMGYSYLRKGDIPKAKEHFRAALLIDPELEYSRVGMMEAIKATNFFYRKILAYAVWMERQSEGKRWVFIIGMIVIVKILPFLLPFYLIFVFWVWFAPPIADAVLYVDKNGRYLMTRQNRILTEVNIGLLSLSAISLAILTPLISSGFLALAFGAFAAIVPVYHIDIKEKLTNKVIMGGFAAVFVGLGAAHVFFTLMHSDVDYIWLVLIGVVVLFTWVSNLFSE